MDNELKVGQSFEVITITKPDYDDLLYKPGNTGVINAESKSLGVTAYIGTHSYLFGWYIRAGRYRKVGKLTVTKIKQK